MPCSSVVFGSREHKEKISRSRGGRRFVDSLGNEFATIGAAALFHSVPPARIWAALNGRINSVHEIQFSFLECPSVKAMKIGSVEWAHYISRLHGGKSFRDQNGRVYKTKPEAASATGLSVKSIQRILSGEYSQVKGYSFRYVEEEDAEVVS